MYNVKKCHVRRWRKGISWIHYIYMYININDTLDYLFFFYFFFFILFICLAWILHYLLHWHSTLAILIYLLFFFFILQKYVHNLCIYILCNNRNTNFVLSLSLTPRSFLLSIPLSLSFTPSIFHHYLSPSLCAIIKHA